MLNICIQKEIEKHLAKYPGASEFIIAFGALCHAVDDLIDRDNPEIKDYKMLVMDCIGMATDLYSCWFYQENVLWLYPIAKNTHRVYSDALAWEKSDVEWKRQCADVWRCQGNEMVLAVLHHLCHLPPSDLRRISLAMREDSWEQNHTSDGKQI
jgi:hypothetical protein